MQAERRHWHEAQAAVTGRAREGSQGDVRVFSRLSARVTEEHHQLTDVGTLLPPCCLCFVSRSRCFSQVLKCALQWHHPDSKALLFPSHPPSLLSSSGEGYHFAATLAKSRVGKLQIPFLMGLCPSFYVHYPSLEAGFDMDFWRAKHSVATLANPRKSVSSFSLPYHYTPSCC